MIGVNAQLGAQCFMAVVVLGAQGGRSSRGGTGGPEGIKEGGKAAEEDEERKGSASPTIDEGRRCSKESK